MDRAARKATMAASVAAAVGAGRHASVATNPAAVKKARYGLTSKLHPSAKAWSDSGKSSLVP
jgi:hypothetical protein